MGFTALVVMVSTGHEAFQHRTPHESRSTESTAHSVNADLAASVHGLGMEKLYL
jgi:hypothetical protein